MKVVEPGFEGDIPLIAGAEKLHDLKMEMGASGMPGVAAVPDEWALFHAISYLYVNAFTSKMLVSCGLMVMLYHHIIVFVPILSRIRRCSNHR